MGGGPAPNYPGVVCVEGRPIFYNRSEGWVELSSANRARMAGFALLEGWTEQSVCWAAKSFLPDFSRPLATPAPEFGCREQL